MIGYVTIGTNNFDAALAFYDALFATIGINRLWKHGQMAAWGPSREAPAFCITSPFDGAAATKGNGSMIALKMADKAQVEAMHAKCLALGGSCEGAPGPRGEHGFYGGYFRDPEGNKLNAYIPG
ncbi:VOC family protein [Cognatishimia sp. WU-CL00825]|uniref:VOC family protein n=1 Tax=Cognatishimia sp. WU-CL00825 TaxID=3127658 RepID=UPI00310836F9